MPRGSMKNYVFKVCSCARPDDCKINKVPHATFTYVISVGRGKDRIRPTKPDFPDRPSAEKAALEAIDAYKGRSRMPTGSATLGPWIEEWMADLKANADEYSPLTLIHYLADGREWIAQVGYIRGEDCDHSTIKGALIRMGADKGPRPEDYKGKWTRKIAQRTLDRKRRVGHIIWEWMIEQGYQAANYTEVKKATRKRVKRKGTVSYEQAPAPHTAKAWGPVQRQRFLDILFDKGNLDEMCLYLMYLITGARREDWLGARWSRLTDEGLEVEWVLLGKNPEQEVCPVKGCGIAHKGRLLSPDAKSGESYRILWLPEWAMAFLKAHRARQEATRAAMGPGWIDHDLIFCLEDGMPMRPDFVTKRFGQLVAETDLPRITLHGLRHSVGSELLTRMSAENAAKYLGHGAEVLQGVYNHMHPELHRDQVLGAMTLTPPTDPGAGPDDDDSPSTEAGLRPGSANESSAFGKVIDFASRRRSSAS